MTPHIQNQSSYATGGFDTNITSQTGAMRTDAALDLRPYIASMRSLSSALTALETTYDPQERGPRSLAFFDQLAQHSKSFGPEYDSYFSDLLRSEKDNEYAAAAVSRLMAISPVVLQQRIASLGIQPAKLRSNYTIEGLRAWNNDVSEEDMHDALEFRHGRIPFNKAPDADNSRYYAARDKSNALYAKQQLVASGDTETTYSDLMDSVASVRGYGAFMAFSPESLELRSGVPASGLNITPDRAVSDQSQRSVGTDNRGLGAVFPNDRIVRAIASNKAWRGTSVADLRDTLKGIDAFNGIDPLDFIAYSAERGYGPDLFNNLSFLSDFSFKPTDRNTLQSGLFNMLELQQHIDQATSDADDPEGAMAGLWMRRLEERPELAKWVSLTPAMQARGARAIADASVYNLKESYSRIASDPMTPPSRKAEALHGITTAALRGIPGFDDISRILSGEEFDDLRDLVSTDAGLMRLRGMDKMAAALADAVHILEIGGETSATDAANALRPFIDEYAADAEAQHGFKGRIDARTATDKMVAGLARLVEASRSKPSKAEIDRANSNFQQAHVFQANKDGTGGLWLPPATDHQSQMAKFRLHAKTAGVNWTPELEQGAKKAVDGATKRKISASGGNRDIIDAWNEFGAASVLAGDAFYAGGSFIGGLPAIGLTAMSFGTTGVTRARAAKEAHANLNIAKGLARDARSAKRTDMRAATALRDEALRSGSDTQATAARNIYTDTRNAWNADIKIANRMAAEYRGEMARNTVSAGYNYTKAGSSIAALAAASGGFHDFGNKRSAVAESVGDFFAQAEETNLSNHDRTLKDREAEATYYAMHMAAGASATAGGAILGAKAGALLGAPTGPGAFITSSVGALIGASLGTLAKPVFDGVYIKQIEDKILPGLKIKNSAGVSQLDTLYMMEEAFDGIGNIPYEYLNRLSPEAKQLIVAVAAKGTAMSKSKEGGEVFAGTSITVADVYGPRLMQFFKENGETIAGKSKMNISRAAINSALDDGRIAFSGNGTPDGTHMFRLASPDDAFLEFEIGGSSTIVEIGTRDPAEGIGHLKALLVAASDPHYRDAQDRITGDGFKLAADLRRSTGRMNHAGRLVERALDIDHSQRGRPDNPNMYTNLRRAALMRDLAGPRNR